MKKRIALITLLACILTTQSFSSDFTLEELNELRSLGLISEQDYKDLVMELENQGVVPLDYYKLKINDVDITREYEVIGEKGKLYFQLEKFFEGIGFTNYYPKNNEVLIYLGDSLEKIRIIYSKNKVTRNDKEIEFEGDYPRAIRRNGKIYVEKEVFKTLFLSRLNEDTVRQELDMVTSFTPPSVINKLLDVSSDIVNRKKLEEKELVFGGKRNLFDLGYVNFTAGLDWNKAPEKSGFERTWSSDLSYQGGFLYGELQFDYDVKEDELSNINLRYDQIVKGHTLDISRTDLTSEGTTSYRFYKDKSYYNDGTQIIITERVPIGSRVELIYMGTTIAVEDERNGKVEFNGPQIRADKTYQMKIYYPDGKIDMKEIKTIEDHNKQNKGEIEYDISIDEQKGDLNGYNTSANFFYGVTSELTLGGGFQRNLSKNYGNQEPKGNLKLDKWSKDTEDSLNAEVIYGSTYNGYSYTLSMDTEFSLDDYYDGTGMLSDKYSFGYMGELRKDNWRFNFSGESYGSYDDIEKAKEFSFTYNFPIGIDLDYTESISYSRTKGREKTKSIGLNADYSYKGYKDILIGASMDLDIEDSANNTYNLNFYFPQYKGINGKIQNSWTNNGEDYEVSINLYNNNYKGFIDFSTDISYSNVDKAKIGITFSMKIDDWFTFESSADKEGNRNMNVGVDRIIDLKNPTKKVTNMDVSRANIITFIDRNDNDIFDEGEEPIGGVEVTIGSEKVITNDKGRATISELSNGIEYDLNPTIRKPSYTLGRNKIKVLSTFSSEVDVHIPIKPMMNIVGYIDLDKSLRLKPEEVEEFYSNIIIQILDQAGKEVNIAAPDNMGYFDMSELYPDIYTLKVYYVGDKYEIEALNKQLEVYNDGNTFDFEVNLKVTDEDIDINE